MTDLHISQSEADRLIGLNKHALDDDEYLYHGIGCDLRIPLGSADRREPFILDIHRSRWELVRGTYQNRAREVIPLVRIDFGQKPHRNPDGEEIGCPHIHIYREDFGMTYAVPLDPAVFPDTTDVWQLLQDFMRFVHIVHAPNVQRGLWP